MSDDVHNSRTAPTGSFVFPTRYQLGCGRRAELPRELRAARIARPLLVTDPGVRALPWFEPLVATLADAGLAYAIHDDVASNPTAENVAGGVATFRAGNHDGIIAVGGGSAIDAAKLIALLAGHEGRAAEYAFGGPRAREIEARKVARIVAVPTTAGSGSELSPGAVVTDHEGGIKHTILHFALMPRAVVADPELTFALPPGLTAATGMDALAHALEAWCAPGYHPMADAIAKDALAMIGINLARACEAGDDAPARTEMLMAASMAAVAFQKGLGLVHAMAHPLGAVTDIHHGLANAVLLPYVLSYSRPAIAARMPILSAHLGLTDRSASGEVAVDAVLDWLVHLRQRIGIPSRLLGIKGIDDPALAEDLAPRAMREHVYLATAARKPTEEDVRRLYHDAIEGRL